MTLENTLYNVYWKNRNAHDSFDVMEKELKKIYPGGYRVVEAFIPKKGYWGIKLVFETEQDEAWFKLRYE